MAEHLYEWMPQFLQGALDLVRTCGCLDGCPACVGPVGEGGGEVKEMTVRLIEALRAD